MAKEKTAEQVPAVEAPQSETEQLALPRETGSEKATSTCVSCGGEVPTVTSAYGSVAPGACPKCWPTEGESQLEAQEKAAARDVE